MLQVAATEETSPEAASLALNFPEIRPKSSLDVAKE